MNTQIKGTFRTKYSKLDAWLRYQMACKIGGYCPTKKEIENEKVKILSGRLKGESPKKTISNILEWQQRNIEFWTERHPLIPIIHNYILLFTIGPAVVLVGMLSVILFFFNLNNFNLLSLLTWFTALFLTILITGVSVIFGIIALIIHFNRKVPIYQALRNVFSNSISIDFLIDKKLGVCRDYAKLTACLLLNIYGSNPTTEIYFAHAPSHVATGIKIENKLYMLDQRLPIIEINKWNNYRHLKGKIDRLSNNHLENVNPPLSKVSDEIPNNVLSERIMSLLNIERQKSLRDSEPLKIRKRKGAIMYLDDEIVNYSLYRWLLIELSKELVDTSRISNLEVFSEKEDLIFRVFVSYT